MESSFDVIVVGLGGMGSSACFHCASHKLKVLGLEQFEIAHGRGSSHGQSRMIRKAYYESPDYVPLLERAYALWDELEAISRRKILFRTGGLYMGPAEGHLVSGALLAARRHGLPHEIFDRGQLRERWSQFELPDEYLGVFEPDAGFLLPELAMSTYVELALRAGAEVRCHEPVVEWKADANHVEVKTNRGTYTAGHLVFTGGPWTGRILAQLGLPLVVTRQTMAWVWPPSPELFALGRLPVWGIDSLDGGIYYGFPMLDAPPGIKLAHHLPTQEIADPTVGVTVRYSDYDGVIREILRRHLPSANGPLLSIRPCMYTNTPDGHFIIDRHPHFDRVQIACGFSGHGFKFASVVGQLLAEAVTAHPAPATQPLFRLSRFSAS